jgi:hypothetical protein
MGLVFLSLLLLLGVVLVALLATGTVGVLFALVWGRHQEA